MTRTLLIVDDNKSVRDALLFLFRQRGYEVLLAENGEQGLALAAKSSVDGAFIDVNMPGMNGIEVCRLLRQQIAPQGRPPAVWIMTGARTMELQRQALEAGALALLGKPFDLEDVFRQLQEVLGPQELPPPAPDVLDQL